MASISHEDDDVLSSQLVESLRKLLWGTDVKHEVFRRWTQGFIFSEDEPTALVQDEGGPCAIIAPVQAFLLKNLLFGSTSHVHWNQVSDEARDLLLCQAFGDIIAQLQQTAEDTCSLVYYCAKCSCNGNESSGSDDLVAAPSPTGTKHNAGEAACSDSNSPACSSGMEDNDSPKANTPVPQSCSHSPRERVKDGAPAQDHSPKKRCFSHEQFHASLRCRKIQKEDIRQYLQSYLSSFTGQYGVLLLLYSIILTKGIDQIKNEIQDLNEPLIDAVHGHGSQCLINLLTTGCAVSNVWDNEKDISGLKLRGIAKRAAVGFLTLLEHLRYCEVGFNLKEPEHPIWLLGSETHLSVLFSTDRTLVAFESPEALARKAFNNFDVEANGFISADVLGDLLVDLDLFSEPEYVKIVREKLDPEQLNIITLQSFLDEFYPRSGDQESDRTFPLFHYNGLKRSCPNNKVRYLEGRATIPDGVDVQIMVVEDVSPIKTCLLTKWPNVELSWQNGIVPSIN